MKKPMNSYKNQQGFTLITILVMLMVMSLLAVFAGQKLTTALYDSSAEATGKYLLMVRGATLEALSRHQDVFALVDTSAAPAGMYPTAPGWANFVGPTATISITDLKTAGFLKADFRDRPPLGHSVHVKFFRDMALCPGVGCEVRAYVYTCWPITKQRSPSDGDLVTCPAPSAAEYDIGLLGTAIRATDGFGGSNGIVASKINGSLFSFPTSDLDIPSSSGGHLVVSASLNSTMFNQFVRQGDTRHIYLNNNLSVAGQISTDKGLLINSDVVVGSDCDTESLYGTSNRDSYVMCTGGKWFELTNHVVMATQLLANGAAVTPPTCSSPTMQPFSYASLAAVDVTMTGTDVNVRGSMAGNVTGDGTVSQNGYVSVFGSYTGLISSLPDSSIRTTQGVGIVGNVLIITPADPGARALVIQGCRYF